MCCNLSWRWHFAYACVGCIIGVSVLFSFFQLNNPTAAYWGLVSGIFAALTALYRWRRRPRATGRKGATEDDDDEHEPAYVPVAGDARGALVGVAGGGLDAPPAPAAAAADPEAAAAAAEAPLLPVAAPYAVSVADRAWALFAVCGMISMGAAFCAYIALCIVQSESLTGASDWMSVVWTFMSLKWSFGLFWAVHTHTRNAHTLSARRRARAHAHAQAVAAANAAANGGASPAAASGSTSPAFMAVPAPVQVAVGTVNSH